MSQDQEKVDPLEVGWDKHAIDHEKLRRLLHCTKKKESGRHVKSVTFADEKRLLSNNENSSEESDLEESASLELAFHNEVLRFEAFVLAAQIEYKAQYREIKKSRNDITHWANSGFSDLQRHVNRVYAELTEFKQEISMLIEFVEHNVSLLRKLVKRYDKVVSRDSNTSKMLQYKPTLDKLADARQSFLTVLRDTESTMRDVQLLDVDSPQSPVRNNSVTSYDEDVVLVDDGTFDLKNQDSHLLSDMQTSYSSFLDKESGVNFSIESTGIIDYAAHVSLVRVPHTQQFEASHSGKKELTGSFGVVPLLTLSFLNGATTALFYPLSLAYIILANVSPWVVALNFFVSSFVCLTSVWTIARWSLDDFKTMTTFGCALLFIGSITCVIPFSLAQSSGANNVFSSVDLNLLNFNTGFTLSKLCLFTASVCFGISNAVFSVVPGAMTELSEDGARHEDSTRAGAMYITACFGEIAGLGVLALLSFSPHHLQMGKGVYVNELSVEAVALGSLWFVVTVCVSLFVKSCHRKVLSSPYSSRSMSDWYYYETDMTQKQLVWMVSVFLIAVHRFSYCLVMFVLVYVVGILFVKSWSTTIAICITASVLSQVAFYSCSKIASLVHPQSLASFCILITTVVSAYYSLSFDMQVEGPFTSEEEKSTLSLVVAALLVLLLSKVSEYTVLWHLAKTVGWVKGTLSEFYSLGPVVVSKCGIEAGTCVAFITMTIVLVQFDASRIPTVMFSLVCCLNSIALVITYM